MERRGMRDKVEVVFNFKWSSSIGKHEEKYFAKINWWRDCDFFPEKVKAAWIERVE